MSHNTGADLPPRSLDPNQILSLPRPLLRSELEILRRAAAGQATERLRKALKDGIVCGGTGRRAS